MTQHSQFITRFKYAFDDRHRVKPDKIWDSPACSY